MMRKRKRIWVLMYRREGTHKVWSYELLRNKEINHRKKHGWRVVK